MSAMDKGMEEPKMSPAKLIKSKVFWVGDYDYRALCMVSETRATYASSSLILLSCPL